MHKIIFVICLLNVDLFFAYEFGDRIKTSGNSVEKVIRKSSQRPFNASSNVPERNAEMNFGGEFFNELLSDGKNLTYDLAIKSIPETVVRLHPIYEYIDVATDRTPVDNDETKIYERIDNFDNKHEVPADASSDDMLSSSSSIEYQNLSNVEKVHWRRKDPADKRETNRNFPSGNLKREKIATSYVNFRPKQSESRPLFLSLNSKSKFAFKRLPELKENFESIAEARNKERENSETNDDPSNGDELSKDDGNQSVTTDNQPPKRHRNKVTYVEVKRNRGTIMSDNHETALGTDTSSKRVTTEPTATTFASFQYFTKRNINDGSTTREPDRKLFNKATANEEIMNKTKNANKNKKSNNKFSFQFISALPTSPPSFLSKQRELPNSSGLDSNNLKSLPNSKLTSSEKSLITLRDKHRSNFTSLSNLRNTSTPADAHDVSPPPDLHDEPPPSDVHDASPPSNVHNEIPSTLLPHDDFRIQSSNFANNDDNSKVYKDILDSTKSIIQKAELQYHKHDTIILPNKYVQPPKSYDSMTTISESVVSPIHSSQTSASSSVSLPRFPTSSSSSSSNLFREDLSGASSDSKKSWPVWRHLYEDKVDLAVDGSTSALRYSKPDEDVGSEHNFATNRYKDNFGEFSDAETQFAQKEEHFVGSSLQDDSTKPLTESRKINQASTPDKSTEFLYDRPNNFHTSFEDYLEKHGIFDTRFSNLIPKKSNNKVEQNDHYDEQDLNSYQPETQIGQGTVTTAENELQTLVPIPFYKTDGKKGVDNHLSDGKISTNNKKYDYNTKAKQFASESNISPNNIIGFSKKDFKDSIESLNFSTSTNQIKSPEDQNKSTRHQQPQQVTSSQSGLSNSQDFQLPSYPLGSPVSQSPKFNVNPPILNTLQKRPTSFRPKPINRPQFPPLRSPFNKNQQLPYHSRFRGKQNHIPFHPRLALSKYLQPPPPPSPDAESDEDSEYDAANNAPVRILPGNLTGLYRSIQNPSAASSASVPLFSTSHEPLPVSSNHLPQIFSSQHAPQKSSSKRPIRQYTPNKFPSKSRTNQLNPSFSDNNLSPQLPSTLSENAMEHVSKLQDGKFLNYNISNYSPLIASHVRGNTPAYQNVLQNTSPAFPTPGPPLRPPFYPTKSPFQHQLFKMPSMPNFFTNNLLSFSSSNQIHTRQRPPRIHNPVFGRSTDFHDSMEYVYPPKNHQSSHFKVIKEHDEQIISGLSGKSLTKSPPQRQPESQPHPQLKISKPSNEFDILIQSESVQIPVRTSLDTEFRNHKSIQNGSQPLPKEIMQKRDEKVPESHFSMLRSLRYGVHGEPLDVWIPIKSDEEKR